ncbi:MAG: GAF domain-containing protein [Myxococcales bacterium]|nr:GAF domain-containing protein [Myxococcales bacterium]
MRGTNVSAGELGLRKLGTKASEALQRIDETFQLLSVDGRFGALALTRPHPLILCARRDDASVLLAHHSVWSKGRDLLAPWLHQLSEFAARLVLLGTAEDLAKLSDQALEQALNHGLAALLSSDASPAELQVCLHQAFELMQAKRRSESRGKWLTRYRYELGELIEIARALTTERELSKLLGLILEKSRFVTGADAGSIYVVEGDAPELERRQLRFKLSQNDSIAFDSSEFTMPINSRSMAGYVALTRETVSIEDVYDLPADSPFGFDRSFDQRVGYRTRSIISTPLATSQGEVLGVLQLINKKRQPERKLLDAEDFEQQVVAFDERSEQLLQTLAAQAGIALENAILYEEIRSIFEGFVRASVDAIEARDPTTSGHSRRVAEMTVGLAHAVERTGSGPYKEVGWRVGDIREIEYAALLHDFGKIGVREHVLVKAKKLYPHELELLLRRFDFVLKSSEAELLQRKIELLQRGASRDELCALDRVLSERQAELTAAREVILHANEPTVLAEGDFERIEQLARQTFRELSGQAVPLLSAEEVRSLSVRRGSLTPDEFDEIRSHVSHTYSFLSKIPWGKSFARVATIAGAHHERLNGTGYPNRLRGEEIPLQSKMMSVSDIFDALTASDRPYKRAVPVQKALDILGFEVKNGHIDEELVRIFTEARIWEPIMSGALY